jgi:hypothetical protein
MGAGAECSSGVGQVEGGDKLTDQTHRVAGANQLGRLDVENKVPRPQPLETLDTRSDSLLENRAC